MEISIYIIFLGTWFTINYKKYGFNGASFLIALYLLGAILGMYMIFATNMYDAQRLNVSAIIYHCICLFLFLSPIVFITNRYFHSFKLPSSKAIKVLYYTIIGFGALTYVSILPKLKTILSIDDLQAARNMKNYDMLYEEEGGLLGYLGAFGSAFSYLSLYLFFYNLAYHPNKKRLIVLLFVCSLADAVTSLSVVGRGGIMRWILMTLFFYFSFRKKIGLSIRKKVIKYVSIGSLPLIAVFLGITISRFSNRAYPVYVSMFDYIGQSFIYFSYIFDPFYESSFGGRVSFPFLFPNDRLDGFVSEFLWSDFSLNTFSTFVGSFYKDMGFVVTLSLAIVFWLFHLIVYRFNVSPNRFYKLMLYIFFSQMIVNGVFYFQYTSTTKMKTFIVLVVFAILLPIILPKQNKYRQIK